MTGLPYRPAPVVLVAPSGTGKTTIARNLVEASPGFVFSVSATTREPRKGERDGIDYQFVGRDTFERMIADGALCEWAEVHEQLYGTPVKNLDEAGRDGTHLVLDIDVQGANQIRRRVPDAVVIFVLPPSADALVTRLTTRATEGPEDLARRLRRAQGELEAAESFDFVVVNDDLDDAVEQVREIVRAETHRVRRIRDLAGEVRDIQHAIDRLLDARFASPSGVPGAGPPPEGSGSGAMARESSNDQGAER